MKAAGKAVQIRLISRPCHLTYPRPQTVRGATLPRSPHYLRPPLWVPRDPFQAPFTGTGKETSNTKQWPCNAGTYYYDTKGLVVDICQGVKGLGKEPVDPRQRVVLCYAPPV